MTLSLQHYFFHIIALILFNVARSLIRHKPWRGGRNNIEKLAILRPFSTQTIDELPHVSDQWEEFLPCDIKKKANDVSSAVEVDILLSYSQTFQSSKLARDSFGSIIDAFASSHNIRGWEQCIREIKQIEANIDPKTDLYSQSEAQINQMWVHGPNQQFINSMVSILDGVHGDYDAVLVMESDVVPVKKYWLDSLLEEAESDPFMILGSKYVGDSWDEFRSSLPLSLQHHINGNALYNVKHSLFKNLLTQLQLEGGTPYHAVPYDYRISQILVEGMLGVLPEIPPYIVEKWSNETGLELECYTEKFHGWWDTYGRNSNAKQGSSIIRESQVIVNYAGTNLLPRHKESIQASLIHGAVYYTPWDSVQYNITLVVSEWYDEIVTNLLSQIDASYHPFSKIVLMVPHNMNPQGIARLSSFQTHVDISIKKRKKDFMDICNVPVDTKYFMITNSYNIVAEHVDLLFTNDVKHLPVIPYIRADVSDCLNFPACVEAYEKSKQFDPQNKKIVQDFDMVFITELRDEFCIHWYEKYGKNPMPSEGLEIDKPLGAMGPSATTYVSFLSRRNILDKFYKFTDGSVFGKRTIFKRIMNENEDKGAAYGESALSNNILEEGSVRARIIPTSREKSHRFLQFAPSFTPPNSHNKADKTSTTTVDEINHEGKEKSTESNGSETKTKNSQTSNFQVLFFWGVLSGITSIFLLAVVKNQKYSLVPIELQSKGIEMGTFT